MNFTIALYRLKKGQCLIRAGWNGKHHIQYMNTAKAKFYDEENNFTGEMQIDPFIAFFPESGGCMPWSPSNTDILANDWTVVDEPAR